MNRTVKRAARLEGAVTPPGDKSISHRAALLNAIADGEAVVSNFCVGDDRASMLGCLRGLGVRIERRGEGESESPLPVWNRIKKRASFPSSNFGRLSA